MVRLEDFKFLIQPWWMYCIVCLCAFGVLLFLNFIVKKINEARLDNRLRCLHKKALLNEFELDTVREKSHQAVQDHQVISEGDFTEELKPKISCSTSCK